MAGARPFANDEVQTVFRKLKSSRDRALFTLGLNAGLRIEELTLLEIRHVVDKSFTLLHDVYIPRRFTKGKRKGRSRPIGRWSTNCLSEWLSIHPAMNHKNCRTMPLFISQKSGIDGHPRPISTRHGIRIIQEAADAAGVTGRISSHSLRKTFARRVYTRVHGDLEKVKEALDHEDINSTIRYLGINADEVHEAMRDVLEIEDQLEIFSSK